MENSFDEDEFRSIVKPTPPYKKRGKDPRKKPVSKLALKKSLRRSSIYDKYIPSIQNSKINMVDAESTESSSCTSSLKSDPKPQIQIKPRRGFIIINDSQSASHTSNIESVDKELPEKIIIHETLSSNDSQKKNVKEDLPEDIIASTDEEVVEVDDSSEKNKANELDVKNVKAIELLSQSKFESIKNWVESIPKSENKPTPKGVKCDKEKVDTGGNIKVKQAINSTFALDKTFLPFHDWMKTEQISAKKKKKKGTKCNTNDKDALKKPESSPLIKPKITNTPRAKEKLDSNRLEDVYITPAKQNIKDSDEVAKLLDTVYGKSWHKNKDEVFSEPRVAKKVQIDKLRGPRTEKKPQTELLYKNPYLDSERQKSSNLLKTLQKQRMRDNLESPFFSKPIFVDDDTPSPLETPNSSRKDSKRNEKGVNDSFISDFSDLDLNLKDRLNKKHIQPTHLNFSDDTENPSNKIPSKTPKKTKEIFQISDTDSDKNSNNAGSSNDEFKKRTPRIRSTRKQNQIPDDLADRMENITIDDSSDSDDDFIIQPKKTTKLQPKPQGISKTPSFLASLSKNIPDHQCDPSALIYKKNYKKHRDALAKKLFALYNEKIFDKCIPAETPIEWSTRMTGTAGMCRCGRRTQRDGTVFRMCKIQLSIKVLDSADRLRDTMVHEMCHAATYVIDEISEGHGKVWKSWAMKAMRAFPELPPITRCHNYAINYKYTYKCSTCEYSFGRHSKSLDLERKRCGHCYGKFEVFLNKVSQNGTSKDVPCTPKKATGFALFVKENYALHKSPGVKHSDLMKLLGKKYAEVKNLKKVE